MSESSFDLTSSSNSQDGGFGGFGSQYLLILCCIFYCIVMILSATMIGVLNNKNHCKNRQGK